VQLVEPLSMAEVAWPRDLFKAIADTFLANAAIRAAHAEVVGPGRPGAPAPVPPPRPSARNKAPENSTTPGQELLEVKATLDGRQGDLDDRRVEHDHEHGSAATAAGFWCSPAGCDQVPIARV
jgi:hypothetical protein